MVDTADLDSAASEHAGSTPVASIQPNLGLSLAYGVASGKGACPLPANKRVTFSPQLKAGRSLITRTYILTAT